MIRPDPTLPIESQTPRVILRMLIYGEARGESTRGALAVGCVPFNRSRVGRWRAMGMSAIMLEPWQFSCFNAGDRNRILLLNAASVDPATWSRIDAIADIIEMMAPSGMKWDGFDPSCGATHYCTVDLWGKVSKQWYGASEINAGRTIRLVSIGMHVFARAA